MKNNSSIRFYDTCALLSNPETIFEREGKFLISSITLKELERIKTAANKDADIKYSARLIQKLLEQHPDKFEVILHTASSHILYDTFEITDDIRILKDAVITNEKHEKFAGKVIFVTNDLALKHIAKLYFASVESVSEDESDNYTGYLEICPTNAQLADFYQDMNYNWFNLYINQYLIIKDKEGKPIDLYKWDGRKHKHITSATFTSSWFGKVAPFNHDIYQQLLCDSFANNKITMARGPAGSGKSYLALAYLMSLLQKGQIEKIIIFCNTVATANSAKLGLIIG